MANELDVERGRLISVLDAVREKRVNDVISRSNAVVDRILRIEAGFLPAGNNFRRSLLSVGRSMGPVAEAFVQLNSICDDSDSEVAPERPARGVFSEGHVADRDFSNVETVKSVNADEDLDALFARIDAEVEDKN